MMLVSVIKEQSESLFIKYIRLVSSSRILSVDRIFRASHPCGSVSPEIANVSSGRCLNCSPESHATVLRIQATSLNFEAKLDKRFCRKLISLISIPMTVANPAGREHELGVLMGIKDYCNWNKLDGSIYLYSFTNNPYGHPTGLRSLFVLGAFRRPQTS